MNNLSWEFFEAYKSLDELCRQILSCDGSGVSNYIEAMSNDRQGKMLVKGWEKDYMQLKRMRWIRNQLAHDSNSFEVNLVTIQDLEWVKGFRNRIMECTDPFSLRYQRQKCKENNIIQKEYIEEVGLVSRAEDYNYEIYNDEIKVNWTKGILFVLFIGILIEIIMLLIIWF